MSQISSVNVINRRGRRIADATLDTASDSSDVVRVTASTLHLQHPLHQGREQMIAEAAYHRAEARGFESGHELDDWLAAEVEVDARINAERAT